jgi:hypothetical protein
MGKVKGQLQEMEEMNGPMDEPTDAELQEIEAALGVYVPCVGEWTDPDVELG